MFIANLVKKFRKKEVVFQELIKKQDEHFVVKLSKPKGFEYTAGQHGLFSVKNTQTSKTKTHMFSVASSPDEDSLIIGTRVNEPISEYKQALLDLKENDTLYFRGLFGSFVFKDDKTPSVMIALGVGITPIRSLLMSAKGTYIRPVEVVYSAQREFLFQEELMNISATHENINVQYTSDTLETKEAYTKMTKAFGNESYYYISGPAKAVRNIKQELKKLGINKSRIINDPFYGYKS